MKNNGNINNKIRINKVFFLIAFLCTFGGFLHLNFFYLTYFRQYEFSSICLFSRLALRNHDIIRMSLLVINVWCIYTVFAHALRCLSVVNFFKFVTSYLSQLAIASPDLALIFTGIF